MFALKFRGRLVCIHATNKQQHRRSEGDHPNLSKPSSHWHWRWSWSGPSGVRTKKTFETFFFFKFLMHFRERERERRKLSAEISFSLLFVNPLGFSLLPVITAASLSPSLSVPVWAPSELVPHSHAAGARSHTYPVTPPGPTVLKKAPLGFIFWLFFFTQTNGTSSSASHHPFLAFHSTSCPWTCCRLCHCSNVVKRYYDLFFMQPCL